LKELRFLFCQTSEHSAGVRYVIPHHNLGISGRAGENATSKERQLSG
jgi:hypothetical protein